MDKIAEIKKDLEKLDKPLINGVYNLTYGDGYFAKSLIRKYGMSLTELRIKIEETIGIVEDELDKEALDPKWFDEYYPGFDEKTSDLYELSPNSEKKNCHSSYGNSSFYKRFQN